MWVFVGTQKRVGTTMSELYIEILEFGTEKTEKDWRKMKGGEKLRIRIISHMTRMREAIRNVLH